MAVEISVSDAKFRNEDNPYGFFTMHYYHSILDDQGKHVDLADDVYPLVPCN